MPSVCFYFQVHQPLRIKRYRIFDIGSDHNYFNDNDIHDLNNRRVLAKVVEKCYQPTNKLLLELLRKYQQFKASFSISGILLDQLGENFPEVIDSFQELAKTGRVEFLAETYYHSLSFLYSEREFREQVALHGKKIAKLFSQTPTVFRNTELIYNNDLALAIEAMGYEGIVAEGADHILGWRTPNFVYKPRGAQKIKLLLKNYRLSDDIAFRFSRRDWAEHPLTAPKFAQWVSAINGNGNVVNIFMDYETFGEHQWSDTGIFDFLRVLPEEILKHPDNDFVTPSTLFNLESAILATKDKALIEDWRRLQTSDHYYYMCTKWFSDGDVHKYFNPYESPYEAFIAFMNVVQDLELRKDRLQKRPDSHHLKTL